MVIKTGWSVFFFDWNLEGFIDLGFEGTVICVPAYTKIPVVHWFFV